MPTFDFPYAGSAVLEIEDPSDYADRDATIEHAKTWEWIHPLDEVMGGMRAAGLAIERFTEHYELPWQIFPITVPTGEGMYGWPAERWLPLSVEIVASAPTA